MADTPDEFDSVLRAHLEVNPKSWAALQQRGVDEQTPVRLDFQFTAPSEAGTRELMRFLGTQTDYEYKGGARDQDDGTRRWMVLGTTSPMTLSLHRLNEWVKQMTADGRENGSAVFDGWGAQVSGPAVPAAKPRRGLLGALARRKS